MRTLLFVFCTIALVGCSSSAPSSPGPVDTQFTLAPGQRVTIGDSATAIRFVGVTSDSRCPAAAICLWSGEAVARFELTRRASSLGDIDLRSPTAPTAAAAGLNLHLLEIAPYPITWNDIQPSQYRATLRVTR